MPRIKKCKSQNKKILLAVTVWFLCGYVVHNTLNFIVEERLTNRFLDCIQDTQGNFAACSSIVKTTGWEKLVRF